MKTKLIWITQDCEKHIGYCARVSNPKNQENPEVEKLLKYCIKNKHWSIFEMGSMCVEITTSRAISAQILRHRSFSFQEFSQRYAEATEFEPQEPRSQDAKNRQNSIDDLTKDEKTRFNVMLDHHQKASINKYNAVLEMGVAKECARAFLPMSTQTKLYMTGTIRSWMHYFDVRCQESTQKEHRDVASGIKQIFIKELPIIGECLDE